MINFIQDMSRVQREATSFCWCASRRAPARALRLACRWRILTRVRAQSQALAEGGATRPVGITYIVRGCRPIGLNIRVRPEMERAPPNSVNIRTRTLCSRRTAQIWLWRSGFGCYLFSRERRSCRRGCGRGRRMRRRDQRGSHRRSRRTVRIERPG